MSPRQIPEGLSLEEVLSEMEFYGMTELSEHIASSMVSSHPGYTSLSLSLSVCVCVTR
jgi:hypothetical protein